MSTESQPLSTLYVFLSAGIKTTLTKKCNCASECLQTLPRFCFPFDVERVRESPVVQHFTFVLTDLEGQQRFGFCRLTSRTCLCILSYLPWFEVFYKLLNNLADYLTKGQRSEMLDLLSALYKHPVPQLGSPVLLTLIPYFIAPDPAGLPSIPESRNVTELVVSVDVTNMLHLYASLLFERRILLASSKLSTFIDNRLEKLNSGNGFGDVFEEEITHCGLSAGISTVVHNSNSESLKLLFFYLADAFIQGDLQRLGNVLKRNSGRWDRGIAENEGKDGGEEGNSDPVAQTPTRIHWETEGAERGQIGSEDNQGSTGSAGKGDHGSTGSTVVQVQGSTGCTTSQKSTGSEDTEQGSTGSPKSISEDKEGVNIQVKTQGEATGNVDRAGNEVHCSSEDSASSSSCSANQQGDSAEELKQTPPREDSGTDQLQSPRVLSAVALFQAKGKSPEPRPGSARFGCIHRGADAGPGRKSPALDPARNGRLETQAASLEALDPEREPTVQSSPSPAPDPLPVKKVSELKKRFEA
ncbi:UNVERIFIED_CONTAM: hypothetical protein FKN15_067851 [Acipenser sinensis]